MARVRVAQDRRAICPLGRSPRTISTRVAWSRTITPGAATRLATWTLLHAWCIVGHCSWSVAATDLQVFCSLGGVIFRTSWGLALGAVALSEGRGTGHYSEVAFRECDQAEAKDGNHCNDTLLCVEAGKHSEVGP